MRDSVGGIGADGRDGGHEDVDGFFCHPTKEVKEGTDPLNEAQSTTSDRPRSGKDLKPPPQPTALLLDEKR